MAKNSFTDAFLKSLQARERRYTVYEKDPRYEGFAVEVLPSGRLSFRYRYRLHGKREKVTIGSYPQMSLAIARERYRQMTNDLHLGVSPAAQKKRQRLDSTPSRDFADLAKDWVKNVLRPVNKNARQDETYLTRDVLPLIGTKAPDSIERADLWACIEVVRRRGTLQAARRVQSVLKRVFDYAVSRGEVISNPVMGIDPRHVAAPRVRDRVLSPSEIPVWLHAIETSGIARPMKLAFRVLLLIPVRKGELLSARWNDVDLQAGLWDIPRENSKNGAPLRHRLSNQVTAIFKELRELAAGSEWVLPSQRGYGRKPMSKTTLNKALAGIGSLPKGVVIHDLRRTIRTNLTELGVSTNVAELCLNHRPTGLVRVYDKAELLDQRYEALMRWESYLQALLSPEHDRRPTTSTREVDAFIAELREDQALRRYVLHQLFSIA